MTELYKQLSFHFDFLLNSLNYIKNYFYLYIIKYISCVILYTGNR